MLLYISYSPQDRHKIKDPILMLFMVCIFSAIVAYLCMRDSQKAQLVKNYGAVTKNTLVTEAKQRLQKFVKNAKFSALLTVNPKMLNKVYIELINDRSLFGTVS